MVTAPGESAVLVVRAVPRSFGWRKLSILPSDKAANRDDPTAVGYHPKGPVTVLREAVGEFALASCGDFGATLVMQKAS